MKQKLILLRKRLLVFLKDKERKGFVKIIWEAIMFWMTKKEFPYFYFGKFLYRKDVKNYKDYLSSKETDKITFSKKLHQFQFSSLLRNKLTFAIFMEKHHLSVPKMLSYNLKNDFFQSSERQVLSDFNELKVFFDNLIKKNNGEGFFVKAIIEMGGKGSFLITKENLEKQIKNHGSYILKNDCIHQKLVLQHEDINRIYPHSVNTIRFDTFLDNSNNTHILSAYMRFGRGGSVLDNSSSGGFYVGIDIEKGQLRGKSLQLMKYGGEQLDSHPDTQVGFDGYEIPYFKEACMLVKKAVIYIPDRIIGWDIAIGKEGPVIIEGNDNNSLLGPDLIYGGLVSHPLYKEIIEEA